MRTALAMTHVGNSPQVEYPLKLGRDAVLVADPLKDPLLLSVPVVVADAPLALVLAATDDEVASAVEDWAATKGNAPDTASNSDNGRVINIMRVQRYRSRSCDEGEGKEDVRAEETALEWTVITKTAHVSAGSTSRQTQQDLPYTASGCLATEIGPGQQHSNY